MKLKSDGTTWGGGTRKPFEPGAWDVQKDSLYWPEHPLANKGGHVTLSRLWVWQDRDYSKTIDFVGKTSRVRYEPGTYNFKRLTGRETLRWPEHPKAKRGLVSIPHLADWQNKTLGGTQSIEVYGRILPDGEFGKPMRTTQGYITYLCKGHPLASPVKQEVREHQVVYWQETGYDKRVLGLLVSGSATIHHRNGVRDDNRPENLELRLKHPAGNNQDDWVHILSLTENGRQSMKTVLQNLGN